MMNAMTTTTATTTLRKVNSICTAIVTHSMNEETCEPMGGYNQGQGGEITMNDLGNLFTAKDPHHYYHLSVPKWLSNWLIVNL
jgi:hypothetical protein